MPKSQWLRVTNRRGAAIGINQKDMGAIDFTDMRCDTILGLSSYFWLIDLSFHNHVVFERFLFPQGHYSIQSRVNRKILCHYHSECLFITIPCRLRAPWLLYPRRIVFPQKFKLDSTSNARNRFIRSPGWKELWLNCCQYFIGWYIYFSSDYNPVLVSI